MIAFMDARCPKCHAHIGWCGEPTDRPPCSKCGHQIPRDKLEADAKHIEDFHKLLATRVRDATADQLRRKRRDAGLSLNQVVRLTQTDSAYRRPGDRPLTMTEISQFEQGVTRPSEIQAALLDRIYWGDPGTLVSPEDQLLDGPQIDNLRNERTS